jgi:hypothetical protein
MLMDEDNRKKLKQFWRKRLLFGLGTVGVLGLGVGTIALMRSSYDELQIVESRDVPERFYQQQIADVQRLANLKPGSSGSNSLRIDCQSIAALGHLKDPRAIPILGTLLQDDQNRNKECDGAGSPGNDVYTAAANALGKFQQKEATGYLNAALTSLTQPTADAAKSPIQKSNNVATVTQKLVVLDALGESSKYNDNWRSTFIQLLPDLGRYQSRSLSPQFNRTLSVALEGRQRDPRMIKSLTALFRDPTAENEALVSIAKVLQTRKQYAHLQDILAIQVMRENRFDILQQVVGWLQNAADERAAIPKADPWVVQSLADVAQDPQVPHGVKLAVIRHFLGRQQYAEVAVKLFASAALDHKYNFDLELSRLKEQVVSREMARSASVSPVQKKYQFLLNALVDASADPEIKPANRSTVAKLQALANGSALSQVPIPKTVEALRSALAYPVLRNREDIQPSEREGYLTNRWDIPCNVAATLIHLGQKEGIQPCLAGLKTVAATQYATEEQRRPMYGADVNNQHAQEGIWVSNGMNMITKLEDREYRFSAMDVAVFSWYQSPRSPYSEAREALLIALLGDSDVELRRAAMFTLSGIDVADEYRPSVTAALKDADAIVRQYAIRYFRHSLDSNEGRAVMKSLEDAGFAIGGGQREYRRTGFRVALFDFTDRRTMPYFSYMPIDRRLAQNPKYTQAVTALRQGTQDADPAVSQAARLVLSRVAQDSNQDFLLRALHGSDTQMRRNSVSTLCRLGIGSLPSVVAAVDDRDVLVGATVVSCLSSWVADLGSNDRRIAPVLLAKLNSIPRDSMWSHEMLEALEQLADRGVLELDIAQTRRAIPMLLKDNQARINKNFMNEDRVKSMRLLKALYDRLPADQASQNRTHLLWNLQRGILAGLGITALILLFSSLRLRNPFPLIWTGYLIFPEEIVAELIALKQRRQAENVSPKRIRRELAYEVILLLWAVHVQIRIDNLHLPPGGNDRAK